MNATRKILIKIELCRSLLDGLTSEKLDATLLFMADEFDNAFIAVCSDSKNENIGKDIQYASKFLTVNKEAIKANVPEELTAWFIVAVLAHIFSDLERTNKFKYVEALLDACYELDKHGEIEYLEQAGLFVKKLEALIDNN